MSALDSVTGSFVSGDTSTPAVNYDYDSIVPSGVDLGSLGGIQSTSGGFDWGKVGNYLTGVLTGKGSPADYAGIAALVAGLSGMNKPAASPGWRGVIDPNKYTFNRGKIAQPEYAPYSGSSSPVMGKQNFAPSYTQGDTPVVGAAAGGLMGLAAGGQAKQPRYLDGDTDGMADKLATNIDGEQAAALSHGEFVIPADVVSHLGNGNSEAGAQQLYKMMDRIRTARTGNKKQGKRIDPDKFTPGGVAGYANGGVVAFATGNLVTTGQGTPTSAPVTSESNLSSWAGPGIADYIQKGTALANAPYQAYTGPLTAGISPLQQQAFGIAGGLQTPASMGQATQMVGGAASKMGDLGYKPVGSDFNAQAAQQYMNPYLQASLEPQLAEARRQSQITQMGNAAKATQAGAFGGSRGALMDAETQRNLGTNLANITGQGYNTAYTNAMGQFNADQQRKIQEGQFGTSFGLQALQGQQSAGTALGGLGVQEGNLVLANLSALAGAGTAQRGIEQQGIDALRAQYEEERLDPYKQIQFQQSLYQGLPVSTVTGSTATSPFQNLSAIGAGAGGIYDVVNQLMGTTPK